MIGTIAGDIIGSRFEFSNRRLKEDEFELFGIMSKPTDDTIMSLATALALMDVYKKEAIPFEVKCNILPHYFKKYYKKLGKRYPLAGYGRNFQSWLLFGHKPYNSWGNGSAMRCSPCGEIASSLDEAEKLAELSASVTHNHPEGIKGAKCVAGAVFLARSGKSKEEIHEYVKKYYEDTEPLEWLRDHYHFEVSCQGSVPQAFTCLWEAENYEDCMRKIITICGDTDTQCAITGTVAEYLFGIPEEIKIKASAKLDGCQLKIIKKWEEFLSKNSFS